jgi:hypothetical protein
LCCLSGIVLFVWNCDVCLQLCCFSGIPTLSNPCAVNATHCKIYSPFKHVRHNQHLTRAYQAVPPHTIMYHNQLLQCGRLGTLILTPNERKWPFCVLSSWTVTVGMHSHFYSVITQPIGHSFRLSNHMHLLPKDTIYGALLLHHSYTLCSWQKQRSLSL